MLLRYLSFIALFAVASASLIQAFIPSATPYLSNVSLQKVFKFVKPKPKPHIPTVEELRAAAVKEAFSQTFEGYFSRCRGQDEFLPVTESCSNTRNAWGASAVDALSTALVMGIEPIVTEIIQFIPTVDFTHSEMEVNLFETTIRYLAGLIAGYDLLKGPFANMTTDAAAVESLLSQSKVLADSLKYSFNTPSGIPNNILNFTNQGTDGDDTNGLATTGSLVLEWQRLSDITGDSTYGDLAQRAESYLINAQPPENIPFPGLLGTRLSIENGLFRDANGGWGGSTDSYYEYLIKMYIYDSKRYVQYRDQWIVAADSTIKYLASHPITRPDLTFLSLYRNTTLVKASSHLTCFDGGSFLLGGQALARQDYIDFGLELVKGCHETYASTATHIGPEGFSWDEKHVPIEQQDFFTKHGFYINNPFYDLRPEVIESYYYAYRVTGDKIYQEWAWDAFVAINATCRVGKGFSSIFNVTVEDGGGPANGQESFIFAEVLKYSYLIQAPVSSGLHYFERYLHVADNNSQTGGCLPGQRRRSQSFRV